MGTVWDRDSVAQAFSFDLRQRKLVDVAGAENHVMLASIAQQTVVGVDLESYTTAPLTERLGEVGHFVISSGGGPALISR